MLQLLGVPLIVAAWTLPALFVLTLAVLFGLAVFRPLYVAWARAWDGAAGWLNGRLLAATRWILLRTQTYAVTHSRSKT